MQQAPQKNKPLKGYGHLFHKLILWVVCLGEVLDVIFKPLDVTFHGAQTAVQNLCRHCRENATKVYINNWQQQSDSHWIYFQQNVP